MAGGTLYFFNLNNFNSRILYGMRPAGQISKLFAIIISIHAPLTGCDYCPPSCFLAHTDISIHAPLTGCDRIDPTDTLGRSNFNPRTPYGMRLLISSGLQTSICYFNPRTPYGMRLSVKKDSHNTSLNFNPRTPYGMRLYLANIACTFTNISIHAPLTGCDVTLEEWLNQCS